MLGMSTIDPPFRADHVGSLLRPPAVLAARQQRAAGDDHRRRAARRSRTWRSPTPSPSSRRSACAVVTDGEFRRAWFHLDFLEQLDGVAVTGNIAASSDAARPSTSHRRSCRSSGRSAARPRHPGRRLRVPRVGGDRRRRRSSIPSPTMVHFRGGRAGIDIDSYPDLEVFFADLAAVLPRRDRRPVRGRLPLHPARRHQPRLPVRSGDARRAPSSVATTRTSSRTRTPS